MAFLIFLAVSGSGDLPYWQWGVLGAVVVSLTFGVFVPSYIYKEVLRRAERAEERERALREATEGQTLPLLREVLSYLQQVLALQRIQPPQG